MQQIGNIIIGYEGLIGGGEKEIIWNHVIVERREGEESFTWRLGQIDGIGIKEC